MRNDSASISSNYGTDFITPPEINPFLVQYLKQVYPNKLPENSMTITDRELGAKVGEQSIIQHLEGLLAAQLEKETPDVL